MMRNVSHWTLGGRGDRPATRLRCGSQLSHNLKLSPNERQESLLLVKKEGRERGCSGAHVSSFVRGTREEATKRRGHTRGGEGGAWIVKAASHKHPHNDLCDERPFGDSFFLLPPSPPPHFLIPAVTMRTCIYFLRPLFLSLRIMHHASLSVPLAVHSSCCALVLRLFIISLFLPRPRAFISFFLTIHRPFLFSPPRNSSRYIFSAGKHAGTRRAQLGSLY